jgi:hypothetical protein
MAKTMPNTCEWQSKNIKKEISSLLYNLMVIREQMININKIIKE